MLGEEAGLDSCLTAVETADLLGLSPRTIYTRSWRERHGLRAQKIGRSLRFRVSELQRFLEVNRESLPTSADEARP